jgi:hypothetical protein
MGGALGTFLIDSGAGVFAALVAALVTAAVRAIIRMGRTVRDLADTVAALQENDKQTRERLTVLEGPRRRPTQQAHPWKGTPP